MWLLPPGKAESPAIRLPRARDRAPTPGNTGEFRLTVRTETIGAGAAERTSLPIRQGEQVFLLVTGQDESSGDFALEFTNFDQFTTPENATLLFPAGAGPSSVALGDLNSDGNPDMVVANALANTLSVLLGNEDGTFQAPRQVVIGAPFQSLSSTLRAVYPLLGGT